MGFWDNVLEGVGEGLVELAKGRYADRTEAPADGQDIRLHVEKGRYKSVDDPRATPASEALDPGLAGARTNPSVISTEGAVGVAIHGGWVSEVERNAKLRGVNKFVTYNDNVRNVDAVAVGVRALLMLIGTVHWDCDPPVHGQPRPGAMRDPSVDPIAPGKGTKPPAAKDPGAGVPQPPEPTGDDEADVAAVRKWFADRRAYLAKLAPPKPAATPPASSGSTEQDPAAEKPLDPMADPLAQPVDPMEEAAREKAEWLEDVLFKSLESPWTRNVRRTGMYKFHGFSIHEWTAVKRDDGTIGIADIENRPQSTIERWDVDRSGTLQGVWQRVPQDSQDVYIPRWKMLYVVDDEIADGDPQGCGVLRHSVEKVQQLRRLEQVEGIGFENDLRGTPVFRAPLAELNEQVRLGKMTPEDRDKKLQHGTDFMRGHARAKDLAVMLDSSPYRDIGQNATPSAQKQWDVELLTGDGDSHEAIRKAIEGKQREVARTMFAEGFLLGGDGGSNRALGEEKSRFLTDFANSILTDIADEYNAFTKHVLWPLNGFDEEVRPTIRFEAVSIENVTLVADMLEKMAKAGAKLHPEDPVIDTVRVRARLPKVPKNLKQEISQQARDMASAEVEATRMGAVASEAGAFATKEGVRQKDDQLASSNANAAEDRKVKAQSKPAAK